jgi:hypothetical protein
LILNGPEDKTGRREQILSLLRDRPLTLDYDQRDSWPRWSLPVRLFWQFGPIPLPPRFAPNYLPAVIIVEHYRWPQTLPFGNMTKEADRNLVRLGALLNSK